MQKLIFVIGATAAGKTYFIEHNFSKEDYDILNVYDYQQKAYDEAGFKDSIPSDEQFRCLFQANEMLLKDIITKLSDGKDVVVEHTLFKAKRRITYIEEIRKKLKPEISFYVIKPSDTMWKENVQKRELEGRFEGLKKLAEDIEFPNVSEGIDIIFEVTEGNIKLKMEPENPEIVSKAHEELAIEFEKMSTEDKQKEENRKLLESMNTRPFWHYCEICGKKEYLTAQQAFDEGWDYPPTFGPFGMLFQRNCGNCTLVGTLYLKVVTQKIPLVLEETLTAEELITWKRIKAEPESLLEEEI